MLNDSTSSTLPPAAKQAASNLQIWGWLGFCIQVTIAIISTVILAFAIFSRQFGEGATNAGTGFSIFLAVCGILALGFSTFLFFRYTRIAKQLKANTPSHPHKSDTIQVLRVGLIASLIGMLVTLVGSEVGTAVVLAKVLSQPQGIAVYDPQRIIRALDILVIVANVNLVLAHFVGNISSLWLLKSID